MAGAGVTGASAGRANCWRTRATGSATVTAGPAALLKLANEQFAGDSQRQKCLLQPCCCPLCPPQ